MNIPKWLATLFAGLLLTGCTQSTSSEEPEIPAVTGSLTLTIFDVGKADAMVIQTENSVVVLDTGNKGDGKKIEKLLEKQGIEKIDVLIISHYDKDHVGGASRLINRMAIDAVYVPDYAPAASEEYNDFLEKCQEKQVTPIVMGKCETLDFSFDDALFTLYAPHEVFYGKNEENDFSLCLYCKHGENTLLFAGDAEEARQTELMNLGLGEVDFLKYPYHGNYLPTSEQFLDSFQPKKTVICCSKKEPADPSTEKTLQNRGIEAYYTQNGTVTVISDGTTLNITQEASK